MTWGYDKIQGALANLGHKISDQTVGNILREHGMDRDTKFTNRFRGILEGEGLEAVKLPPRSPNLSPHIERFVRSIKDESLSRIGVSS